MKPDDGRSTRWDEHKRYRVALIRLATRQLARRFGCAPSMDMIAATTGIPKASLYRYYASHDDLLRAAGVGSQVTIDGGTL